MRNITRESSPQKDSLTRLICEELPSQKEYLDRPRHGKSTLIGYHQQHFTWDKEKYNETVLKAGVL